MIQLNPNAPNVTKRPWAISQRSSPYMEGTIVSVGELEVAGVWKDDDAEFLVRVINAHDEVREVLLTVKQFLDGGADRDDKNLVERVSRVISLLDGPQ